MDESSIEGDFLEQLVSELEAVADEVCDRFVLGHLLLNSNMCQK